jgi:hypothetical protein
LYLQAYGETHGEYHKNRNSNIKTKKEGKI